MRLILPILFLAACSQQPAAEPEPELELELYAGQGRDRLCISGDRAGFISYGDGDANCSAKSRVERSGNRLTVIPAGDVNCRIDATLAGDAIRLGPRSAACAYYCGPDADYSGRAFIRQDGASPAVDFAGDPLC